MAKKKYDQVFKEKLVKLHLENTRTISSLVKEYGVSRSTLNGWIKSYCEECKESEEKISPSVYEENRLLKKRTIELEKENAFLKKAAAFFAKEIYN
jgi:transposase